MGSVELIQADLATMAVDAQVNAWNGNVLPWFLLVSRGVSGAIRRQAGWRPFWRLWLKGPIPQGEARVTHGGRGPAQYLIHVAGIRLGRRATPEGVHRATDSAIKLAFSLGCRTVAFPLLGAGTGGLEPEESARRMWPLLTAGSPAFDRLVVVVRDPETLAAARSVCD